MQASTARTARVPVTLAVFTLAGFAIGCNEFASVGVLPQVAAEFSPVAATGDPDRAAADVSIFVWAYALGVVIGAPILGALASRYDVRWFLAASLVTMSAFTAAVALAPDMALVTTLRVLSGVPHAAFLGIAAIAAARVMGSRHAARGVAVVIGGLTIANMVGAPLGTWVGQTLGWRWCYAGIALLFIAATLGVFATTPDSVAAVRRHGSPWRGLRNVRMWTIIGVYAFVNGGVFAVLTFISVITTVHAQMPGMTIAFVVAASGIGMTVGNYVGGVVADRNRRAAMALGACAATMGFVALLAPRSPILTIIGFALVGFALSELAPFTQTLLMRSTPHDPGVGSSMNSLCANLGSVVGGACAGFAVGQSGAAAAIWIGLGLMGAGLVGAVILARSGVELATRVRGR
ncbi:MFS transporter [Microbacterium sp. NPDC089696]|uniref:MFS transporter n=1 Tax=Microbacterium sp. NPDC089696 TaxID=3364199 RepID=UPI003825647C